MSRYIPGRGYVRGWRGTVLLVTLVLVDLVLSVALGWTTVVSLFW